RRVPPIPPPMSPWSGSAISWSGGLRFYVRVSLGCQQHERALGALEQRRGDVTEIERIAGSRADAHDQYVVPSCTDLTEDRSIGIAVAAHGGAHFDGVS